MFNSNYNTLWGISESCSNNTGTDKPGINCTVFYIDFSEDHYNDFYDIFPLYMSN